MGARCQIINEDRLVKNALKSEGWPKAQLCVCVMRLRRSQSFASLPSMLSQDKVNKQCRVEGQGSLTLKTKHHPHQTPCLRNKENKPAAGPRSTDIRALLSSTLTTKKKPFKKLSQKMPSLWFIPSNKEAAFYILQTQSGFKNTRMLNPDFAIFVQNVIWSQSLLRRL